MTSSECQATNTLKATSETPAAPCGCSACGSGGLAVNPFEDLRAAYGMLLGAGDFDVLMGNPRGKQMLHSSWLHGSGVVWGYPVTQPGVHELCVGRGLAVDGIGRDLFNAGGQLVDLRPYIEQHPPRDGGSRARTIPAYLVACFSACPDAAVPVLADPCDVTRQHDDCSRVLEGVSFELRETWKHPRRPYRRVRALLGLAAPAEGTEDVQEAWDRVAAAPTEDRAKLLVREFRTLSARDALDLAPAGATGDQWGQIFPRADEEIAVLLARISIPVTDEDDCDVIGDVVIDTSCRDTLLPTATIQELTCGLAPGVLGRHDETGTAGPQVIASQCSLTADGQTIRLPLTRPVLRGSVRGAVEISSINLSRGGWVVEDIDTVEVEAAHDKEPDAIVVTLLDRPANALIRIVVRGSGRRPVLGLDGVPLAGVAGEPPGTAANGRDAVVRIDGPQKASADEAREEEGE